MKKIFVLIAVALFLFAVSCAGEADGEVPEYISDGQTSADFAGATFNFSSGGMIDLDPVSGETSVGDRILERYAAVEKEYNCNIGYIKATDWYSASEVVALSLGGLPVPDILNREVNCAYELYKVGFLVSMNDVSTIDATDEKWSPIYFRAMTLFDGTPYGFFPIQWQSLPLIHGCMFSNNQLIEKLGLTDPYERIENGTWTFSEFKKDLLQASFYDENGARHYGLVAWGGIMFIDFPWAVCFANGAQAVVEKGGQYYFGLDSQEALYALDYIVDLMVTENVAKKGDVSDLYNEITPYYFTRSHEIDEIQMELEDFGFLPFPTGPNATDDTTSAYISYDDRYYICSMTENDPDDIGTVIDYIFEPLDDSISWKEYGKYIFTHDIDVQFYIDAVSRPNYNYQIQFGDAYDSIDDALQKACDGKTTSAQTINSVVDKANDALRSGEIYTFVFNTEMESE